MALQTGQVTFSQQPKPAPARPAPRTPHLAPLPEGFSLAPSWLRLIAFILDILIWSAAAWVLTLGYALLLSAASREDFWWVWNQVEQRHLFAYMLIFGFPIYRAFAHALTDRTIGKAMVGLKIMLRDGRPCGLWRALGREVALFFSALPCFMGLFWAIVDPYKQGWHDLVAGTFVVQESEQQTHE